MLGSGAGVGGGGGGGRIKQVVRISYVSWFKGLNGGKDSELLLYIMLQYVLGTNQGFLCQLCLTLVEVCELKHSPKMCWINDQSNCWVLLYFPILQKKI